MSTILFLNWMNSAGYTKSSDQCWDKAKKLKTTYRKIKDKHNKIGDGRKKWPFLDTMDAVLGDRPSTRPTVLIDTLGAEPAPAMRQSDEFQQEKDSQEIILPRPLPFKRPLKSHLRHSLKYTSQVCKSTLWYNFYNSMFYIKLPRWWHWSKSYPTWWVTTYWKMTTGNVFFNPVGYL